MSNPGAIAEVHVAASRDELGLVHDRIKRGVLRHTGSSDQT